MKQLVCEMCGSADLIKQEGVFVCQSCGTKYSVEDAKKMMMEESAEISNTVSIDQSEKYNNLAQLARDAFSDGRFESAYDYCSEALVIAPRNPELIAMQGLAVLGKEEIVFDIPLACINSMKRWISIMPEHRASFNEKRECLEKIEECVDTVTTYRILNFTQQIESLEAQKAPYTRADAWYAGLQVTRAEVDEDYYEVQRAQEKLNEIKAALRYNEELDAQIAYLQERKDKVSDFCQTYKSALNEVLHAINKEESEYDKNQTAAYWEAHKEEKDELENRLQYLQEKLQPLENQHVEVLSAIDNLRKERDQLEVPAETEIRVIQEKISDLRKQRDSLGIFKGNEKKQLSEEIAAQFQKVTALEQLIESQRKEMRDFKNEEISELKTQSASLEKEIVPLQQEIQEIRIKLATSR